MSQRHDRGRPLASSGLEVGAATKPTSLPIIPQQSVKGVKVIGGESVVVTGRERSRQVVVIDCPGCGAVHLHSAAIDAVDLRRQVPCGTRYPVRLAQRLKRVIA